MTQFVLTMEPFELPMFSEYFGIDYSGAETADSSLKGLRVYRATRQTAPAEQLPPVSPRKYWTRRGLAEWLAGVLETSPRTIVAIDHGFSFPKAYFERHKLGSDWEAFLEDFRQFWPTDQPHTYVDFARYGRNPTGLMRQGDRKWRRRTEIAAGSAKSVFHFDVQGSVAKSTHAGLPWLLFLRQKLRERVHFWPFDGWDPDPEKHVIAEVYPRLWSAQFPNEGRTPDQHDAFCVAAWLRNVDGRKALSPFFTPRLSNDSRNVGLCEGWILGVMSDAPTRGIRRRRTSTTPALSESLPPSSRASESKTTAPGYVNRNNQVVIRRTSLAGNDHNQRIFVMHCGACDAVYGANGSDIHLRKCPACQGGAPGLAYQQG